MFVLYWLLWRLFHGTSGGPVQRVTWSEQVNPLTPQQDAAPRPSFYLLPMFLHAPRPLVPPELFRPAPRKTPLSPGLTALLLPQTRPQQQAVEGTGARAVEVRCGLNAVSVRLDRAQLGAWTVPSLFRLGSCETSRITPRYLYFHFGLTECDGRAKVVGGQLVYTYSLYYTPAPEGYVIRVPPLKLPIHCHYNRFHYSYQVGFKPQVQLTTFVKNIRSKRAFSLTVCNAQWEPILPGQWFILGEPVYFVAQTGFLLPGERLYVDSCYATSTKDPKDMLKVDIITNYGCMTDSRREGSRSQFLFGGGNVLKFSVDTFLFRAVSQVQYLHCSMSVGFTSSPTAKSCNYNKDAGRWEELKASPLVCSCCNSICSEMQPSINTVSSPGWLVGKNEEMKPRSMMTPFQTEEGPEMVHLEEKREETVDVHLKEKHTFPFETHIISENEKEGVSAEKKEWRPGVVSLKKKKVKEGSDADFVVMKAGSQQTEYETYGIVMSDETRPQENETSQAREWIEKSSIDSVNGLSRDTGTSDVSGTTTIARNVSDGTKYNASNRGSSEDVTTAVITVITCSNTDKMTCSSTHSAIQHESITEHGTMPIAGVVGKNIITSASGVSSVSDSNTYQNLSGSRLAGIHSSASNFKPDSTSFPVVRKSGLSRKALDKCTNKSVDTMSAENQAGYSVNGKGSGGGGLLQIRGLESGTSAHSAGVQDLPCVDGLLGVQDFDSGAEEGDGLRLSQFTGGEKTKRRDFPDHVTRPPFRLNA